VLVLPGGAIAAQRRTAVLEFQVVKGGWLAERGGGSAGSIDIVTKSGANTLHGDVFLFGQSGIFNARPKLEETLGAEPALQRYRAGAAIGGPISRDQPRVRTAAHTQARIWQANRGWHRPPDPVLYRFRVLKEDSC